MAVHGMLLLTTAEKNAAEALNDENAIVEGREIDNPLANNLGLGPLVGMWMLPAAILNAPAYSRWLPTLGQMDIHILDSEVLFLPVEEV